MKIVLPLLLVLCCGLIAVPETFPLEVSVQTPNPGYSIRIERVDMGEKHLHVLVSVISPPPGQMNAMVISEASAQVGLLTPRPKAPVKLHILNRPWNWGDDAVVENVEAYEKSIGESKPIRFMQKR